MSTVNRPPAGPGEWWLKFQHDLSADIAFESRLLVKEVWVIAMVLLLVLLRELLL